jgi:hypothetical protein
VSAKRLMDPAIVADADSGAGGVFDVFHVPG